MEKIIFYTLIWQRDNLRNQVIRKLIKYGSRQNDKLEER